MTHRLSVLSLPQSCSVWVGSINSLAGEPPQNLSGSQQGINPNKNTAREYAHDASRRPLGPVLTLCYRTQGPPTATPTSYLRTLHSLPSPVPFASFFSQVTASSGNRIPPRDEGRFASLPHIPEGQDPFRLFHVGVGCVAPSSPPRSSVLLSVYIPHIPSTRPSYHWTRHKDTVLAVSAFISAEFCNSS